MKKTIYFVRHGKTGGTEKGFYQQIDTPLSEEGLRQASVIAERCLSLNAEVVIASTMERALKTGKIIAETTKLPLVETLLFREILRPTVIRGRSMTDPEVVEIMNAMILNQDDPKWHYADEENFYDIKNRAIQALDFLVKRPESKIIVATHGHNLRSLMGVLIFGNEYTPAMDAAMHKRVLASNTGLTMCEVDESGNWKLLTLNDYAHLGE